MAVDILMPNLGFDAQEARLIEWLKQPGEPVKRGEALALIESDKANVELESVADGTLLEHRYPADTLIAVGSVIARVGSPTEAAARPPAPSPVARRVAEEHRVDLGQIAGSGARGRITRSDVENALERVKKPTGVLALPRVRRAAREQGIDLATATPTGPHGDVTLADLEALRSQQPTAAPAASGLSRARRVIGERLARSMQEAPHFYVTGEFDLEAALNRLPDGVRVNDLLQYLTVQTLLAVPELNATYHEGVLHQRPQVDLAIAVALPDGLLTPVIPQAERYSLRGLADESRALVKRARDGKLTGRDLQPGTFTLSNLGVIQQVEHFTAVINPPQVAILAAGAVKPRPVVIEGGLFIRRTVHLTLSGDHRVVDGMHLARFLQAFQQALDTSAGA